MRNFSFFIAFFILSTLTAQEIHSQQKADYDIELKLNPLNHSIDGHEYIMYQNNSKKTLKNIYIYLYANEYKSNSTQLAQELIKKGNTGLYFATKNELGGYDSFDILYKASHLRWEYVNNDKTIIKVSLQSPILPNEKIKFEIKFNLHIPKDIDGFGYNHNQYNITNGYPQMIDYNDGWNTDAKTTKSLLYSGFGKYNVKIKIPENYIVVSTGTLKTEKEIEFLEKNIINNIKERAISKENQLPIANYKTIEFASDNSTAFAWFASPRFAIINHKIEMEDSKTLDLNIYFDYELIKRNKTKRIDPIVHTVEKAISFYNKEIGDLPHNQITLILTAKHDRYRVYPTLLVMPKSSSYRRKDKIKNITHFITSLWLNDYFTCDEYKTPWIKNGLLGYYHGLYMHKYISSNTGAKIFDRSIKILSHSSVLHPANNNRDFYKTKRELLLFTYYKPAISYNYLRNYLGDKNFTDLMHSFFKYYKYKQISGSDIKKYFEQFTNEDLSWFFDGLISSPNPYKYHIAKSDLSGSDFILDIKNDSKFEIPIQIGGLRNNTIVNSTFTKGFTGRKKLHFTKGNYDKILIDPNNLYYKNSKFRNEVNIKKSLHYPNWLTLYKSGKPSNTIFPISGYNNNDGLMLGIALASINSLTYKYNVSAMYGFRSKSLAGIINYKRIYNLFFNSNKIEIGINARRFHKHYNKEKGFNLKYTRISPYISINLGNNEFDTKSKIKYRFSFIKDETLSRNGIETFNRYINGIVFNHKGGNIITPYKFNIGLEHQYYNYTEKRQYLMVYSTINSAYMYKNKRYLRMRLYGATYLHNTGKYNTGTYPGTLSLIGSANNDYGYDHWFVDRSAQDGFWSRQLMMNTGGFKTAIGNSHGLGQSNNYVVSANIRMDLPFGTFLKPYLDLGIYGYLPTISEGYSNKFLYSSGIIFQIVKDKFEIYLPILNSKAIEDIYKEKGGKIYDRISFMANFALN